MTRAYKLAVTVWGVMALSGCAVTRDHDKPNSSDAASPTTFKIMHLANDNAPKFSAANAQGHSAGASPVQTKLYISFEPQIHSDNAIVVCQMREVEKPHALV